MPLNPQRPAISNVGAVGVAIESTPGNEAAVAFPADFILASDVNYTPNFTPIERNFLRPSLSRPLQMTGRATATLSFTIEVMGSGTAAATTDANTQRAATPKWADLLRGCGFGAGVTSATPVPGQAFNPTTNNQATLTIFFHSSGQLHKLTGAVGTFTLNAPAGGIATMSFTFSGNYIAPTVTADPAAPAQTIVPPIVQNTTFALGGYAPADPLAIQAFTFDMGNNIVERESISSPNGFDGFFITGRAPTMTINPERVFETGTGSHPFFGDASGATSRTAGLTIGNTSGNRLVLTMPAVQLQTINVADRNGMLALDLSYAVSSATAGGNDEVQFRFT